MWVLRQCTGPFAGLVYRSFSAVCICLEPCDGTQFPDNGVSFCSFNPSLIFSPLFALQLFLLSLVFFPSKMFGQIQTRTHFTSTHYSADVFTFPAKRADSVTLMTWRDTAQTKTLNREGFDPGLNPHLDPGVSLQLVKPFDSKGSLTLE